MIQESAWNDSWTSLWRKIDNNLWEAARAHGYNAFPEPNALDGQIQAMRKATLYTAFIVDNP